MSEPVQLAQPAQPPQSRYRLVDRYVVHEGSAPLAERVARIIPEDAAYVVLDLDRTVHLGVTIGEQLGWEILGDPSCKHDGVGDDGAFFSLRRPLRSLAGVARGVRYWSLAGLWYAGTVRLGARWRAWHRLMTLRFGPEYIDHVQAVLRAVLMANAADYSREQLESYAERAWRRWQRRLVVDREVVEAIREHCPRLRAVILSSASTAPTVEHAARALGVDGYVSSGVDVYPDGEREVFSAPAGLPGWLRRGRPRYFSRPGAVVHNSSARKVSLLRMHYPELFATDAVSVGISDNNYGEDRTWPDHFHHVVALNSRYPFSPFVAVQSPCMSIQTIDARPAAASSDTSKLDWFGTLRPESFDKIALSGRFAKGELVRLETLLDELRAARDRTAQTCDANVRLTEATIGARLDEAVRRYNGAPGEQRKSIGRELDRLARQSRRVKSQLVRVERECALLHHELELLHKQAASTVCLRQP